MNKNFSENSTFCTEETTKLKGNIHSVETFGSVDGPGVRLVIFFQGCIMRCKYCHNPDTWNPEDGKEIQADEVIRRIERNSSYYKKGGITATGGEPLMQPEFLLELFTKAKQKCCICRRWNK